MPLINCRYIKPNNTTGKTGYSWKIVDTRKSWLATDEGLLYLR
jgi:hypothetical protein